MEGRESTPRLEIEYNSRYTQKRGQADLQKLQTSISSRQCLQNIHGYTKKGLLTLTEDIIRLQANQISNRSPV